MRDGSNVDGLKPSLLVVANASFCDRRRRFVTGLAVAVACLTFDKLTILKRGTAGSARSSCRRNGMRLIAMVDSAF